MNYQKIDASLSAALSETTISNEPDLIVFVRTMSAPNNEQKTELKRLGIRDIPASGKIFSAQVSPQTVKELSEKSWVRRVSLSQQLKHLVTEIK